MSVSAVAAVVVDVDVVVVVVVVAVVVVVVVVVAVVVVVNLFATESARRFKGDHFLFYGNKVVRRTVDAALRKERRRRGR